MIYVVMFLAANILANLTIAWFGAGFSIVNAFLFIALDLTARDKLHDAWHGHNLRLRMLLLIGAGAVVSAVLNVSSAPIALASFMAFAAAGLADTFVYQRLFHCAYLLRVNGSNVLSAAVDSLVFPALAFGFPLLWGVVLGQFVAKVAGGGLWSLILRRNHD